MLSTVAHLTEPVGSCGGGPVIFHAPRCLRHLCKQLRVDHIETVCEHARFAGCWPFAIAAVSAERLYAHHHAADDGLPAALLHVLQLCARLRPKSSTPNL
jgi:hypothetical protein